MRLTSAAFLLGLVVAVTAFGSSDDRFLKKYAMMKIYESCFGAEVVKEIRQEMKAACARCAASSEPKPTNNNNNQVFTGRLPPSLIQALSNSAGYLPLGDPSQDPNQSGDNSLGQVAGSQQENNVEQIQTPILDTQKLQQAIFSAVRIPQPQNYPVPNYAFRVPYPQQTPFQQQSPFQTPFQSQGPFQSQSPFQPQMFQQAQSYLQPWGQPYQGGYQGGFVQPYPFFGNRASREMDFRTKLELLTSRTSGQVRNVTCVMQELGYLDQNLEPNYEKIAERIANLPVSDELKSDIQDGLQFCQEFSQCVPESKKNSSPLSRELLKPMFFFRCYKHKKLEACIMKDVRDKFGGEEELDTETDFRTLSRAGRDMKLEGEGSDKNTMDNEELAASMYDFLYGSHDAGTDAFV